MKISETITVFQETGGAGVKKETGGAGASDTPKRPGIGGSGGVRALFAMSAIFTTSTLPQPWQHGSHGEWNIPVKAMGKN